jgi:hypothetical protein
MIAVYDFDLCNTNIFKKASKLNGLGKIRGRGRGRDRGKGRCSGSGKVRL